MLIVEGGARLSRIDRISFICNYTVCYVMPQFGIREDSARTWATFYCGRVRRDDVTRLRRL